MAEKTVIMQIKKDFAFLADGGVLAILLFGSSAKDEKGPRDRDICIVAPGLGSKEIMANVYRHFDPVAKRYDVYTFDELALYMKWEVIQHHKIVWTSDDCELHEYFRDYLKQYDDQKHRFDMNEKEVKRILKTKPNAKRKG